MKTRSNAIMICSFSEQFTGGQSYSAETPCRCCPRQVFWARRDTQKCHSACAQRGAKSYMQKCHSRSAPRQFWSQKANAAMPKMSRSKGRVDDTSQNATVWTLFPTSLRGHCENAEVSRHCFPEGATIMSQKCQEVSAPHRIWARYTAKKFHQEYAQ